MPCMRTSCIRFTSGAIHITSSKLKNTVNSPANTFEHMYGINVIDFILRSDVPVHLPDVRTQLPPDHLYI